MNTKATLLLLLAGVLVFACVPVYDESLPPVFRIVVDGTTYYCQDYSYNASSNWAQLYGCDGYSDPILFRGTFKMEIHRIEKEKE